jgi:Na+/melibiose symporter-like transporter
MLRLLRMRDFRLLWFGGLISMIGDWALLTALPFELYRRTGSTLATAGVLLAGLAPAVIFGSAAGVFVDRWDRKRLMVWVNIGLAVALLPLFAIDALGLWLVYAVLLVSNVLEQLFVPAEVALLPQLVGPEHLVSANSLSSLNRNLARLIGPALGGLAVAIGGLSLTVVADLATYVIAAILIGLIAPGVSFRAARDDVERLDDVPTNAPPTALGNLRLEWREGIAQATSHPVLRALLIFALLTALGEGFLGALFVPWVSDILHGDDAAFAAILSAQAVGGLIGAFAVGRFLQRVSAGVLMGVGAMVFAIIDLAIFSYPLLAPIVLPAIVGMVVVGIPASSIGVGNTTLQQRLTADTHRGRIVGLFGTLSALGMVVGTTFAGLFGKALGIVPLLVCDAFLYFACGLLVYVTATRSEKRARAVVATVTGDPA